MRGRTRRAPTRAGGGRCSRCRRNRRRPPPSPGVGGRRARTARGRRSGNSAWAHLYPAPSPAIGHSSGKEKRAYRPWTAGKRHLGTRGSSHAPVRKPILGGKKMATRVADRTAGDKTPAKIYSLVFGATLLLVGIIGFFVDAGFDAGSNVQGDKLIFFEVNGWHNLVHIASGALGLALAGSRAGARTFALGFGAVYL